MTRRRQAQMTKADSHGDAAPVIYSDALLPVCVVVEADGELWLVPRRPGGWSSRQRLTMTPEARQQRLTPARDATAAWLGIVAAEKTGDLSAEKHCEIST